MSTTPAGPTEQQPRETAVAFEAFRTYLEQGPSRSTAKVARALGKSKTLIDRWSSKWEWVRRVREFEAQATRVADDAHLDAIARRSKRQAEIAQLHGEASALVAHALVQKVAEARQAGEDPFAGMEIGALATLEASMARAHNRAVLTERLALGLTTEQGAEPMPRSQAEEQARRLTDLELDARLSGVDEVAQQRRKRERAADASAATSEATGG